MAGPHASLGSQLSLHLLPPPRDSLARTLFPVLGGGSTSLVSRTLTAFGLLTGSQPLRAGTNSSWSLLDPGAQNRA